MTKRFPAILIAILALSGCAGQKLGGNSGGWPQSERDTLVSSCVQKAKADAPALDEGKLNKYCSCYQVNIEKQFATVESLNKATAQDMTKAAEPCLPIMTQ